MDVAIYLIIGIISGALVIWNFSQADDIKQLRKEIDGLANEIANLHDEDARLAQHKHLRGKVVLPDRE